MRYRVRFNLERGTNYMKWQILDTTTNVKRYYDPKDFNLHMLNCKLRNRPKSAQKIYAGANKFVCAWIDCNIIFLTPGETLSSIEERTPIHYNPRKNIHWLIDNQNSDNKNIEYIISNNTHLYANNPPYLISYKVPPLG